MDDTATPASRRPWQASGSMQKHKGDGNQAAALGEPARIPMLGQTGCGDWTLNAILSDASPCR